MQLTLEDGDDDEIQDDDEDGCGLDDGIRQRVAGQPVITESLGGAVLKQEVYVRYIQAHGQELIVAVAIHEADLSVERLCLIL